MANFSTIAQAQASAQSEMAKGTYTEAHGAFKSDGTCTPVMRVLNKVTSTGGGDWSETTTVPA